MQDAENPALNLAQVRLRTSLQKRRGEKKLDTLYRLQEGMCFYCRRGMNRTKRSLRQATVEHLTRRADGGDNGANNLVAACLDCNSTRGSAAPEVWRRRKRRAAVVGPMAAGDTQPPETEINAAFDLASVMRRGPIRLRPGETDLSALVRTQRGICFYCLEETSAGVPPRARTVDPLDGGDDGAMVLGCSDCKGKKANWKGTLEALIEDCRRRSIYDSATGMMRTERRVPPPP